MGLNRVSNPAKLRRLSARVGAPVIRAYARFFADQNVLLAFTDEKTAWVVPREGEVERLREFAELSEYGVRVQ